MTILRTKAEYLSTQKRIQSCRDTLKYLTNTTLHFCFRQVFFLFYAIWSSGGGPSPEALWKDPSLESVIYLRCTSISFSWIAVRIVTWPLLLQSSYHRLCPTPFRGNVTAPFQEVVYKAGQWSFHQTRVTLLFSLLSHSCSFLKFLFTLNLPTPLCPYYNKKIETEDNLNIFGAEKFYLFWMTLSDSGCPILRFCCHKAVELYTADEYQTNSDHCPTNNKNYYP